jgi:ATP-dependent Clp protease protease subunit
VVTYCDGFAASIASVVFMAGDKRVMSEASLLMVHNAWTWMEGNAAALRKQADDLDKITHASIEAYKAHSTLSEDEIKALLDAETWILPEEALAYGFATKIERTENKHASQSVRQSILALIKGKAKAADTDGEDEEEPKTDDADGGDTDGDPEAKPEKEDPEEDEKDPEGDPEEAETNATQQKWGGLFVNIQKI